MENLLLKLFLLRVSDSLRIGLEFQVNATSEHLGPPRRWGYPRQLKLYWKIPYMKSLIYRQLLDVSRECTKIESKKLYLHNFPTLDDSNIECHVFDANEYEDMQHDFVRNLPVPLLSSYLEKDSGSFMFLSPEIIRRTVREAFRAQRNQFKIEESFPVLKYLNTLVCNSIKSSHVHWLSVFPPRLLNKNRSKYPTQSTPKPWHTFVTIRLKLWVILSNLYFSLEFDNAHLALAQRVGSTSITTK